jgi:hypothetical protein
MSLQTTFSAVSDDLVAPVADSQPYTLIISRSNADWTPLLGILPIANHLMDHLSGANVYVIFHTIGSSSGL